MSCLRVMVVHRASRMMLGIPQSSSKTKSLSYHVMLEKGLIHPAGRGLFSVLPLGEYGLRCHLLVIIDSPLFTASLVFAGTGIPLRVSFLFIAIVSFYICEKFSGQRVIDKLVRLIEEELNAIGAFKMSMPSLGAKELWRNLGRWDKIGAEIFRVTDREGKEFCLQPTAEEMITQIAAQRGLRRRTMFPFMLYQTTAKFRDEMNPRFGLLRSREFLMNDLYSFDISEEDALKTYHIVSQVRQVCHLVFEKLLAGINAELARRHEKPCSECTEECLKVIPSVEIAHTFQLGDLFSESLGARYQKVAMVMNCYGLGIGFCLLSLRLI
uniref:proline--tRNA ligase n=1 Tax=Parascaris equorum TaxID=6256 RepID=A0A914S5G1_PAREQ